MNDQTYYDLEKTVEDLLANKLSGKRPSMTKDEIYAEKLMLIKEELEEIRDLLLCLCNEVDVVNSINQINYSSTPHFWMPAKVEDWWYANREREEFDFVECPDEEDIPF